MVWPQRPTVAMDQQKQDNIRRLLNNIDQVDNVPAQMLRDFKDDDEADWWSRPAGTSGGASSAAAATAKSTDIVDNWEDLTDDADFGSGESSSRQEFAQLSASGRGFSDEASGSGGESQTFARRPHSGRTFSDVPSSANYSRPSTSQGLPRASSSEVLRGADDDAEGEEDVPQVSGLLEYNRAHADIIYLDEEMGEGQFCDILACWQCSVLS